MNNRSILPSTGEKPLLKVEPPRPWPAPPVPKPAEQPPSGIRPTGGPKTEQLPGEAKFNSLHISHLPLKMEGQIIHLFVAILNGEAVGQIIAQKEGDRCDLRMLFVAQKSRHMGIGSRLVSRAQVFAHNEHCKSIEIAVHKGNVEARKFWIQRKFIDSDDTTGLSSEHQGMVKAI